MTRNLSLTTRNLGFAFHVLGVVFLVCNASSAQEKSNPGDKIRELKEQRIVLLVKIQKMTAARYHREPDKISADQVRQTTLDVFAARLDLAESKEDRIKICEEMVKDAVEWEKAVQDGINAGQVAPVDGVRAQAHLLATRIELEKAKASK